MRTKIYLIEEILSSRLDSHGKPEYLIKWKDQSEQSWQPVDNLFAKGRESTSSLQVSRHLFKNSTYNSLHLYRFQFHTQSQWNVDVTVHVFRHASKFC